LTSKTNMKMRSVMPGYIGMSRGDTSINAIIWGEDELFYFYPVTPAQATAIEEWAIDGDEDDLRDALPDATEYDLDMFYAGREIID
jgi:hypothetical protein